MRITFVNLYYPPDGAATGALVASLARHRARAGDEVTVLTSSARYAPAPATAPATTTTDDGDVDVQRVWSPGRAVGIASRVLQYAVFFVAAAWRIRRLPKQDVVVLLTTPPWIAMIGRLHQRRHPETRLVLWSMDLYPDILHAVRLVRPNGLIVRLGRLINRRLLRRMDRIVCLDAAMAKRYDIYEDAAPRSIIPNFEPNCRFDDSARRWPHWNALGLEGRFVVAYTGNLGWGHDVETTLDAMERLREEPVHWLFVSGGRHVEALRRAAERRHLGRLTIVPRLRDRAECDQLIGHVDVALVTLTHEAGGLMSPSKMHAALAMGSPILYVGPPGTNVDEAILRFDCGASIRNGDAEAMTQFINACRQAPEHLNVMRQNARRAYLTAYGDEVVLPQWDGLLAGVADRKATQRTAA